MPLSDIVNVQITRQTQTVSEQGFGNMMVLGTFKNWSDRIRPYRNMQEVAADFSPSQLVYIAAQDYFAQPITPELLYIGRRAVDNAVIKVETAMENKNYTVTVEDIPITINSVSSVSESTVSVSGIEVYTLTFSNAFTAGNKCLVTINGLPLSPAVNYVSSNAATLTAIASWIQTWGPNVSSAVSNGTNAITVTFNAGLNNIVNSAISDGGSNPPTCTITKSGPLVTDNLINVALNGTIVGTVTSKITYSTAFTSGSSTVTTVNDTPLSPVLFSSNNADTLTAIAAQLAGLTGIVASATSNGTDTITVVFEEEGNNTINSSVTTGGSAPTATISEGGFTFDTDSLTTLTNIATAMQDFLNADYDSGIAEVNIGGVNDNILVVSANPNQDGLVTLFTVKLGASQSTATIVNNPQDVDANTIADQLATAINNQTDPLLPVTASTPSPPDGTFILTAVTPGDIYNLSVSTDITNANQVKIEITQSIPFQAYTVKIGASNFTYQAPSIVTNESVAANLVLLINDPNNLLPVSAIDNLDGSFEIIGNLQTDTFVVQVSPTEAMTIQKGLIIEPYTASANVVDDIQAIQAVNDDWYAISCTDRAPATVLAIAAYIETQLKIFGTSSSDPNIINLPPGGSGDTTSIAYLMMQNSYARSFVIYHQDADIDFPECAWFGNCLPFDPGSETWMFKTLNSVAPTVLSTNQQNNAFSKNCNTYQYVGGVPITQQGTVAEGEYIDTIRGIDWLTSTIQSYVYSVLIVNPKVPYTDAGITAIETQIRRALNQGIDNNFIALDPPYEIFVPKAANVPSIDKANRVLNNVSFEATLAGAIQKVMITGTVSV